MQCFSGIAVGGIPGRSFKHSKPKKNNGIKPDLHQVLKKIRKTEYNKGRMAAGRHLHALHHFMISDVSKRKTSGLQIR
jgi:hypothetical protein